MNQNTEIPSLLEALKSPKRIPNAHLGQYLGELKIVPLWAAALIREAAARLSAAGKPRKNTPSANPKKAAIAKLRKMGVRGYYINGLLADEDPYPMHKRIDWIKHWFQYSDLSMTFRNGGDYVRVLIEGLSRVQAIETCKRYGFDMSKPWDKSPFLNEDNEPKTKFFRDHQFLVGSTPVKMRVDYVLDGIRSNRCRVEEKVTKSVEIVCN